MKCNPLRWLLGIIPILLLAGVAVVGERDRIEKDLSERTRQTLNQAGLGWASVIFDGRDAVLTGLAAEEPDPGLAATTVAAMRGVRVVRNQAGLIDRAERYDWVATRREGRVRLTGYAPNEKTRRDIIGLARGTFPTSEIADKMDLARGAPALDIWLGGVGFALKQLALLKSGSIRLEGTELTVAGEAVDAASYRTLKTALAGEDANWGRVVMAVGKAGEPADRDKLAIWFGDLRVAFEGERDPAYSEAEASQYMKHPEITIRIEMGLGKGRDEVWTCDLTKEYVAINGDYRS